MCKVFLYFDYIWEVFDNRNKKLINLKIRLWLVIY